MKTENTQRATLTIAEVAAELGVNLIAAYEMAKQVGFPALTVGKRIIVPKAAFDRWLSDAAFSKQAYRGKHQKKGGQ